MMRFFAYFLMLMLASAQAVAIVVESGNWLNEIENRRNLTFTTGSNAYIVPNATDISAFGVLADSLYGGNLATADAQALALGYEVVEYTDTVSGDVIHGLRETLIGGVQTKGWGSFYLRLDPSYSVLLEVDHPRFDTNSWDIAGQAYQNSNARGFLMAGAHRNTNGTGTADVAHLSDTIFQQVHESWTDFNNDSWSIHGFNVDNYASFPADTDMVVTQGSGQISSAMLALDAQSEAQGFKSYGYNTEAAASADNILLNDGVDGSTFSSLGGTTNLQGQYSRANGNDFLQIEYEQSIRFNSANRASAAVALVNTMDNVYGTVPSPAPIFLMLLGVVALFFRRRLKR